ncbi:MAG TPA: N-formylglutamate deformylase [Xanthomonadales bacterium]|nr:N-formylglutamate deformylase [Xanthomonadales bacterium]
MALPPTPGFELIRGNRPLLLSLPHDGCEAPPGFAVRLTPEAARLPDTDWHVARLYDFAVGQGASVLRPRYTRYLIDLNRPPDDAPLYPGQNGTGLCPLRRFDGGPIYRDGMAPDAGERQHRVATYWQPYHAALADELERLHRLHGRVVLWEGHSIRSECPLLFEGRLPDLNLGCVDGRSCSPALRERLAAVLAGQDRFSHVIDGRFKGGYITRHYGQPQRSVEAVQLEIAQCAYMDEATFEYREDLAERVRPILLRLFEVCL